MKSLKRVILASLALVSIAAPAQTVYGVTTDNFLVSFDATNEYLRAVTEQGLGYGDLKAAARASLEYSFLPGPSLWAAPLSPVAACAKAGPACDGFLSTSRKAAAQWRLEREFEVFEAGR